MEEIEKEYKKFFKRKQDGLCVHDAEDVIAFAEYYQALQLQQTGVMRWFNISEKLPNELETVWLTNGKGWTCLGCLVVTDEGFHWAESNGVIYQENDKIVSECESEDLDVVYWHPLPKTIA